MSELTVGQLRGLTVNSNVITVPSGHTLYAPGHVIQVVNGTTSTNVSTSAATFIDSGLTATITPKSATSKILVLTHQNIDGQKDLTLVIEYEVQLLRGSTNLSTQKMQTEAAGRNAYRIFKSVSNFNWLDSPNTTSPVTYKTQFRALGAAGTTINLGFPSHITLMEIAQ
jgi:hypothetical protein